jgi:hypothetical protein
VEVAAAVAGLAITVVVVAMAIRLLRQARYRYDGDRAPQSSRSFRETMVVWLMGPRDSAASLKTSQQPS